MIWSSDAFTPNHREFDVQKDPLTDLMTVHIGSGQYEFQAMWK
jgi:hypothetical protein